MTELFVIATWAAHLLKVGGRITFGAQRGTLAPVMNTLRRGFVPLALFAAGLAPFTQAHGMPGEIPGGTGVEEHGGLAGARRDGISLDEAVRMAEAQFHARVVRTDVQDEDGRKVYVLKLLSDGGRVVTVRIDAATGRMR